MFADYAVRYRRHHTRWLPYFQVFLKWMLLSVAIGLLLGAVGTVFHYAVDHAQEFRLAHAWTIWLLPVAGLVIVASYHACGIGHDRGTNAVLESVICGKPTRICIAPLIFAGTVLTHLGGGSVGRESAALQLGGSIAGGISTRLKLSPGDTKVLTMCGMSAAFSAIFGTPITSALFAVGVASSGAVQYAGLMPCIVSSLCGYFLAEVLGVPPVRFALNVNVPLNVHPLLQVLLLSVLCAWLAVFFCFALRFAHEKAQKLIPNDYLRIVAGAFAVIALTYLVGTRDYNGAGMGVISAAIQGVARPEAFALKLLFTAVTIGAGFKGGEIVPSFYIGATFGCAAAPILGISPSFGAAVGLVALFCGVTNCPITAILLSVELFGAEALPFFALAAGISYLLSGYTSLYGSQKIVLSKWNID